MDELHGLLKAHFGFESFLPMQQEIVSHVLSGQDGLVLMPTGGGKSLCYQLPALALGGVTLVVSPLIALMKDQVDGLKANDFPAEFLNSSLTTAEAAAVRSQAVRGALKLLYIAPERLATPGFDDFLRAVKISLIAIDEAHCISEWGHDFRPDYRNLKSLRDGRPSVPILALTATAEPKVREDIVTQLELRKPRTFLSSFNRPNLVYRIEPKDRAFDRLLELLREHRGESAIIYCFSRRETERIAGELRARGVGALAYHAGLDDAVRSETQERFIRDEIQVIAATIAFGMGIDKPDVRLIVHYSIPKTIEAYYQETGRAGRDGLQSECVLFYSYRDKRNHDFFIKQIENSSERDKAALKLRQVIDFCQSTECRRRSVLQYFGEQWSDEKCGACDVCLHDGDQVDSTVIAQKILSAVIRTGERFGARYVIDVLRGSRSRKVIERGHDALSVHGAAHDYSVGELRHFVVQLAGRGLLALGSSDYPTYRVTQAGRAFLRSDQSLALARPKTPKPVPADSPPEALEYDVALFQKLRKLRKSIADAKGVPPYIVFGDRTLRQMARSYPRNRDRISRISGVGRAKLEEYSEEFLRVIREHVELRQLQERPNTQAPEREDKSARALSQTYVQTRNFAQQGLSIEEVARRSGLDKSTVIGHIERCVADGEQLDISPWLPSPERCLRIEAAFRETEPKFVEEVCERLGDGYSLEELRLVRLRQMQRSKGKSETKGRSVASTSGIKEESAQACAHAPAEELQSSIVSQPVSAALRHTAKNPEFQRRKIETGLETLGQRTARVLRRSLGVDDGYWPTFQEIGADLKASGERVRQMVQTAVSNVRFPVRLRRLESLLGPRSTSSGNSNALAKGTGTPGSPHVEPEPGPAYIQQVRVSQAREYKPWSSFEERQLVRLFQSGLSIDNIAAVLERRPSAVRTRLNRLGLT
ncbi:MAG: DNA helicase RecQ [Bryobacterales bacterium]|nr:DNA helicase RecQ [Bryobacterales bacterium]MDE0620801.1 DNA helicase RecQ [Bryobacterales bacterium]